MRKTHEFLIDLVNDKYKKKKPGIRMMKKAQTMDLVIFM